MSYCNKNIREEMYISAAIFGNKICHVGFLFFLFCRKIFFLIVKVILLVAKKKKSEKCGKYKEENIAYQVSCFPEIPRVNFYVYTHTFSETKISSSCT